MKKALTIAGSDSGGGAGIQADLKTFMAFGVYGMSAITALTAQNTIGVQGILDVSPEFVWKQIESVMVDIGVDAAKAGMLSNASIAATVADAAREFRISNLVVDPVMVAKSGDPLLSAEARAAIRDRLIPMARIITPNLFEAEALLEREIRGIDGMRAAARDLAGLGCGWVVLKGGRSDIDGKAIDVLCDGKELVLLTSPWVDSGNTQGAGCTFASAIAAGLAKGLSAPEAVKKAKEYISEGIRSSPKVGKGRNPANHLVGVKGKW